MWSTTKLIETHCDGLLPTDGIAYVRRQSLCSADNASSSVYRLPSSLSDSSIVPSVDSENVMAAKFHHPLLLIPQHRHHQQQQQHHQEMARETVERRATGVLGVTANGSTWLPCRPTTSPPVPVHHQLLALYRSQFWTRLIASILGTLCPATVPAAPASVVGVQELSAGRPSVPESQCVRSQTLEDRRDQTDTEDVKSGDTGSRSRLVNWLLDSPSSLSPAESSNSKTNDGNSSSLLEAAARQLLLEQTVLKMQRGYGHFCADGLDLMEFGRQSGPVPGGGGVYGAGQFEGTVNGGVLSCRLCCKRYAKPGAMKMHARTHTLPCRCAVCGKAFSRPWLLQGHLRTHTGERPFQCSQCQRAFADRSNLRAHLQTHAAVKKYACLRCAKTFSRMSLLVKHREGTACPGRTSQC